MDGGVVRIWARLAHVPAGLPGPGRIDLYAGKPAGTHTAVIMLDAYDAAGEMLVGGALPVWELTQALAALTAPDSQARRLAVREDGRCPRGWVDLVCEDAAVRVVVTAAGQDRRTAGFDGDRAALAADVQLLLRHYLRITRTGPERLVVLPDVRPQVVVPG